jgi:hypothetical protein
LNVIRESAKLKPIIRDILTGVNGESYALVKVMGFMIVLVFLALEIASFIMGKPFDESGYGLGAGLVIGTLGTAIKLTETSEPKNADPK